MIAAGILGALAYAGVAAYALQWAGDDRIGGAARASALVLAVGCAHHVRSLVEALA